MNVIALQKNFIYKNRQRAAVAWGPKLAEPSSNPIQHSPSPSTTTPTRPLPERGSSHPSLASALSSPAVVHRCLCSYFPLLGT